MLKQINIAVLLQEFTAAGLDPVPSMSVGADGQWEILDPTVSAVTRAAIQAVIAAHNPTAPVLDTTLINGMERPELQAILGLLAKQQDTDVATLQAQAIETQTNETMASKKLQ